MANQKIIDWFLKKYDAGEDITPEIIDFMADGLRPRNRGRQNYKILHLMYMALNHICTVEELINYVDIKDPTTIRKLIANAKDQGWEVVDLREVKDSNGKKITYKKGQLSISESKQVWIHNGVISRHFSFKLSQSRELLISFWTQGYA